MREIEKIIAKSRPIPQKRHGNSTVDKCIKNLPLQRRDSNGFVQQKKSRRKTNKEIQSDRKVYRQLNEKLQGQQFRLQFSGTA